MELNLMLSIAIAILLCSLFNQVTSQTKMTSSEDGTSGTLSFQTPDLNDEESHSPFMPDILKCDACKAVAFQLHSHFNDFNEKKKYLKYNVPESDVIDLFETTCTTKTFESYGIKKFGEVNRLSGPGTEAADTPGIMAGGGKWPGRITDMCEQYMGELGELEVYNVYKKDPTNVKNLEKYLCYGSGIRNECKNVKEEL